MLVIPALRRLRQEDLNFEASLGYVVKFCLKKTQKPNQTTSPKPQK
jgi:hypothetical protein